MNIISLYIYTYDSICVFIYACVRVCFLSVYMCKRTHTQNNNFIFLKHPPAFYNTISALG